MTLSKRIGLGSTLAAGALASMFAIFILFGWRWHRPALPVAKTEREFVAFDLDHLEGVKSLHCAVRRSPRGEAQYGCMDTTHLAVPR